MHNTDHTYRLVWNFADSAKYLMPCIVVASAQLDHSSAQGLSKSSAWSCCRESETEGNQIFVLIFLVSQPIISVSNRFLTNSVKTFPNITIAAWTIIPSCRTNVYCGPSSKFIAVKSYQFLLLCAWFVFLFFSSVWPIQVHLSWCALSHCLPEDIVKYDR